MPDMMQQQQPSASPSLQIIAGMQQNGGVAPAYGEKPEASESRKALVGKWTKRVKAARAHWEKKPNGFKQMRANMKFAGGVHYKNQVADDERIIIDITQRHINTRTAALYARNPTIACKRHKRLDFKLWDMKAESLQQLFMRLQQTVAGGMPPSPADQALLLDIQQGMQSRKLMEKLSKTAEILVDRSLNEQDVAFKEQCKGLIPRILTCSVGYVRTDYQRELTKRPETLDKLNDITSQLATLQRLQAELQEGEIDTYSADMERAMEIRNSLQAEQDVVIRQGLVYSFTKSTKLIPDKKCKALPGFVGSEWVAEQHELTADDIEESFHCDVAGSATPYVSNTDGVLRQGKSGGDDVEDSLYVCFEIFNKKDGLVYWICDGYDDFLEEPAPPKTRTRTFWQHRAIVFNRQESEDNPFPKSDVCTFMAIQREINRTMESLRQHRIAARPLYVGRTGILDKSDKKSLGEHAAHDIIELSIPPEMKPEDAIGILKKAAIDPNIYTLEPLFDAFQRITGSSEANLGGTSGASATESSISEASRISSLESNKDDMDDLLSGVAQDSADVHMQETDVQTATRLVGPGAVWSDLPMQDIVDQLYMTIRAGSSGRPNRDRTIAALERIGPIMVQLPGVKVDWLVETYMQALDEGWDLADVYDPSLPSIVAQNQMAQPSTGDPATDPNAQGGQGGDNAPAPPGARGGPQPSYQQSPGPAAALPAPAPAAA